MNTRVLLFLALTPSHLLAQVSPPAVFAGARVRVEARITQGRVEERYLARSGGNWILVATTAGDSAGALSIHGSGGEVVAALPMFKRLTRPSPRRPKREAEPAPDWHSSPYSGVGTFSLKVT